MIKHFVTRCIRFYKAKRAGSLRRLRQTGTVTIGVGSYGKPRIMHFQGDSGRVVIGNYCSIAGGVTIFTGGNHRIDWASTYPFRVRYNLDGAGKDGHPATKGDVHIENDVWIGYGATILSGTTIANGAVVAAGSVVAKDVPPYAIVGGNPSNVIGYRFTDEQRQQLLAIRWWDWDPSLVLSRVPELNGMGIEQFLQLYGDPTGSA